MERKDEIANTPLGVDSHILTYLTTNMMTSSKRLLRGMLEEQISYPRNRYREEQLGYDV